jgi:hypothetical protein
LLVAGCYAFAAVMVHLAYRLRKGKREAGKHYIWVAEGRQPNMEWYVRSLYSYSRRTGEDVRLTIVDCGMTEESRVIAERLAFEGKAVTFCQETGAGSTKGDIQEVGDWEKEQVKEQVKEGRAQNGKRFLGEGTDTQLLWRLQTEGVITRADQAVLIDLQNPEDLSKMPF